MVYKKIKAPPNSPDLNPIEWLWQDVKRYISLKRCTTEEEVTIAILEYRDNLTPDKCQNYINKLKKVISLNKNKSFHV